MVIQPPLSSIVRMFCHHRYPSLTTFSFFPLAFFRTVFVIGWALIPHELVRGMSFAHSTGPLSFETRRGFKRRCEIVRVALGPEHLHSFAVFLYPIPFSRGLFRNASVNQAEQKYSRRRREKGGGTSPPPPNHTHPPTAFSYTLPRVYGCPQ